MKKLLLITLLILNVGCAHKEIKKVEKDIADYNFKTNTQIKNEVNLLLSHHPEFDSKQKSEIKAILINSLEQNSDLKKKESQMIQHLIKLTISDKASYDEIQSLRLAMKKNYKEKSKLFETTSLKLKKVIGITVVKNNFELETSSLFISPNMR